MQLTWREFTATVLVAAIVVLDVVRLVAGGLPLVQDTRAMAVAGLGLGGGAALVAGQSAFEPEPWHRTALLGGVAAAVLGLAALLLGTEILLAAFVMTVVLTWVVATVAHRLAGSRSRRSGRGFWHG